MRPSNKPLVALAFAVTASLFRSHGGPPLAMAAEPKSACTTDIVSTAAGRLCGNTLNDQTRGYFGIPYGESTAREKRWTAPVPKAPWKEVRQATQFGAACPQLFPEPSQSEDCLSLNVWAPKSARPGANLPVMVSIHGGAFEFGSSSAGLLDGAALSARGQVIVVSPNYRLGALGFLATDDLRGNYGFLDQALALQWVKDNIRAFGGDPNKVTVFGQSAGGYSALLHTLSAPASAPLFRAAILQSALPGFPLKSLDEARRVGKIFKVGLGCKDVACLRALDVSKILNVQSRYPDELRLVHNERKYYLPFAPTLDGAVITRAPLSPQALEELRKPMIVGTTRDELMTFFGSSPVTPMHYAARVASLYGPLFDAILAHVPVKASADNAPSLARVLTDDFFHCGSRHLALAATAPIYAYLFDQAPSFDVTGVPACRTGGYVCHNADLPFVYGNAERIGSTFTQDEARLSNAVMAYWSSFAKTLDPNPSPLTTNDGANVTPTRWPRFERGNKTYLRIVSPSPSIVADPFVADCTVYESLTKTKPID